MEQIKDTIKEVLGTWKARKKTASLQNNRALLRKVFTNKELRHVRFGSFQKGILSIKVDSSAWLYQLNLHKRELLQKARDASSEAKDIRFSLGDITGKDS